MNIRPIVVLAAFAAVSVSHAAVLVSFDMTTITGTNSTKGFAASAFDSGLTSSNLLKNNLVNASPINTVTNYGGSVTVGTWTTNSAQALDAGVVNMTTTLSNANYIKFTLTPEPGMQMDITSITFQAAASSNSTPRSVHLFSSVDGFTSSDVLSSAYNAAAGGGANGLTLLNLRTGGVLGSYSYIATAPEYSGIIVPVEFRIYLQTGSANQDIDFDNIVVNGAVSVIPEPSAYTLLASGFALGLAVVSRRRR